MKIENMLIEDIKRGYIFDENKGSYQCALCGKEFMIGEIYPINGHFYEANRAISIHGQIEHPDYVKQIINEDSKYNTLTKNQKQVLQLFASNHTDKEIAKELEVSTSTVRHQKFMFREKAKQAKLYLAIYERVFNDKDTGENTILAIHNHARMVDERYVITEKEKEQILQIVFTSMEPLKLKAFPAKEKKKIVVLSKIIEQFEQRKKYSEKEVNEILKDIYADFVTIRRYLIEYGYMERNNDGSEYWLTK